MTRIVRRMGPFLILESRLFANIILEPRLFANVTRIWQRTGYSLILEPRLFAWRLYEGQKPLKAITRGLDTQDVKHIVDCEKPTEVEE